LLALFIDVWQAEFGIVGTPQLQPRKEMFMQRTDSRPEPAKATDGNRPVQTLRHRSIKATIWRNETDKGPMFNVTITRSWRDKESGEWRDTHSLGYDDLMNVAALMYEAHAFISSTLAKETRARPTPRRK
jgi:hypothetical protein